MLSKSLTKKFFSFSYSKKPLNISITGGAGNIGYAIAFRIASGETFGHEQPVNISLVDIPDCEFKLKGIKCELDDCSFPLVNEIKTTTSLSEGFKDCDYAFLIGIKSTISTGERVDGLAVNAPILVDDGTALNENASADCKVIVVANPVNTNCLIAMSNAPRLKKENFHALSRLDHNRAVKRLAQQLQCHVSEINKVCIWGNHDSSMFADLTYSTYNENKVTDLLPEQFVKYELPFYVANRWKEILYLRGLTSCASAANAAIDHAHDLFVGTGNRWVSKAIYQEGKYYNIPKGIVFSMPCTIDTNSKVNVVSDLILNDFQKEKLKVTTDGLLFERRAIEKYLKI